MHELSVANRLIEIATEHARQNGAARVLTITVKLGALTCVHKDALRFGFEWMTEGTLLEGADLHIVDVPATVFCQRCDCERQLPGIQSFRCPVCGTACGDIRGGKELDLETIEITSITNDDA